MNLIRKRDIISAHCLQDTIWLWLKSHLVFLEATLRKHISFLFSVLLSLTLTPALAIADKKTLAVAKKVAALPGFWELIGGFLGILVVAWGAQKWIIAFLRDKGVIKDPLQEFIKAQLKLVVETQSKSHDDEQKTLRDIYDLLALSAPMVHRLLPGGIPLEKTPFYALVEKLDLFDATLGKELLDLQKAQKDQNERILLVLRYLADKLSKDGTASLDMIIPPSQH